MKKELTAKLKHRKGAHRRWKQGQITSEENRDTVQACRNSQGSQSPPGDESG